MSAMSAVYFKGGVVYMDLSFLVGKAFNVSWRIDVNLSLEPSGIFKTDSAQSSSNKCKNYLLKIYSQHIDFLNTT